MLVGVTATPAQAQSAEDDSHFAAAMDVVGYNWATAEANGFKVVTDEHGNESSVPVTSEAKALLEAHANRGISKAGYDEVTGDCGMSWVGLRKDGNTLEIGTGYSVYLPVWERHWGVVGGGLGGTFDAAFNGSRSDESWSGYTNRTLSGGGWGHVAIGSFVELWNGAICYSGNPGTDY